MAVLRKNDEYKALINNKLNEFFKEKNFDFSSVLDAMQYSLSAGGKRIRGILVLEFARLCGADISKALPVACAIEMVHTYSLIHDDLPCMDDDDLRRGQPSCHVKFNEATALLAGDALLTMAFEVIAKSGLSDSQKVLAVSELASSSGAYGMIGGQVMDLKYEGKKIEIQTINNIHKLKTAALIKAACRLGCICANENPSFEVADVYAENIGLAFQIVDDVLDITSTSEVLGKPINSDSDNQKETYATFYGVDKCREIVENLTQNAVSILDDNANFLREFAISLKERVN
jgi:geranylgeranyl diphosphate synthase type II